jgi:hypothetical protein
VPISHTVVVVRDPVEVVGSLARRNGMEPGQGASLWLRYLVTATTQPALVVRLDDLTDRPDSTARRLARYLELPEPSAAVLDEVRANHEPGLLHRGAGTDGAVPTTPIMEMAHAVWNNGDIDLGALPESVSAALAQGWLGPPANRAALDAARAEYVDLREKLRKWHRWRKAQAAADPDTPLEPLPDVEGIDDAEPDP